MGKLKRRKPNRRQKEILFQQFGLHPEDWFVARWLPEVEYITLVNRHTEQIIQKFNPDCIGKEKT